MYTATFCVYKIPGHAGIFVHGVSPCVQNSGTFSDLVHAPGHNAVWLFTISVLGSHRGLAPGTEQDFAPPPLPISHSSGILLHAPILCPSPSPGAQPDTPVQMSRILYPATAKSENMHTFGHPRQQNARTCKDFAPPPNQI